VVSATSQTGVLHCIAYSSFTLQLLPNVRTHTLLNGLKENGLKGELVDFMWVDFAMTLVDLVTNWMLLATWMKFKIYSSSTLGVCFVTGLFPSVS
jgi:hypothetical protein